MDFTHAELYAFYSKVQFKLNTDYNASFYSFSLRKFRSSWTLLLELITLPVNTTMYSVLANFFLLFLNHWISVVL